MAKAHEEFEQLTRVLALEAQTRVSITKFGGISQTR